MRIGVNAQLLPQGKTYRSAGVASYVRQLTDRLPRLAPQHEFTFFTPPDQSGENVVPSGLPTSNPVIRIAWEQSVLPFEVRRRNIDLLHSPVNVSPLILESTSIVTLHDLAFLKYGSTFTPVKRTYLRLVVGASLKRASRVITPSRSSRRDVIEEFGLNPDRIRVIPLGVDERYHRRSEVPRPHGTPYILFVGTLEPRKNLPLLLRAFAALKRDGHPHHLALVGPRGWMYSDIFKVIDGLGIADSVIVPGFIEDLLPWYNHADLFVYPSVYEGFGLPPLEAMACGAPVVTSSAGSLREVVDEAALVVPPTDEAGFASAMRRILDDGELRRRLVCAGSERSSLFSWNQTIHETVAVYEELMAGPGASNPNA